MTREHLIAALETIDLKQQRLRDAHLIRSAIAQLKLDKAYMEMVANGNQRVKSFI